MNLQSSEYQIALGPLDCYHIFHLGQLLLLFVFSRAAPVAYGGSQASGPVGAVAPGLCQSHSNVGSKLRLQPTPQLTATLDPYPLSKARDEPATSWFLVAFVNH